MDMRGKMGKLAPLITKSKEIYENALDARVRVRVRVPSQVTSAEEWIVSRDKTTTALTLASATPPKHEPGIYSCSHDRLLGSTRINGVCPISAKGLCSKMLVGPIAQMRRCVSPLLSHPYLHKTCTGCIMAERLDPGMPLQGRP